jgi:serine/threonine protein kinase
VPAFATFALNEYSSSRFAFPLQFILQGKIHDISARCSQIQDLKPENFLLTSNDANAVIKLTDFGFAKEVSNYGLVSPWYFTLSIFFVK